MVEDRHTPLGLTNEQALDMYKTMLLARRIDERMWLLNRAGKMPFVVSCQGKEAAQVGAAFALNREKDFIAPYYRDMAMVLSFGMTAKDMLLGGFAKAEDPSSGGRQMPSHFSDRKNRIVTGSSPVTTQIPHAVGIALTLKMKKTDYVAFTSLGEGSTNQGDFHEGLNFAGVHKLPVIVMVQNNKYAISVPIEKQLACARVSDRAIGYGMQGITIDENDPLIVYKAVKEARDRAINGKGPTLIEVMTERLTSHTSDDDERSYRNHEELDKAKQNDNLLRYKTYLQEVGVLTEELIQTIEDDIAKEVNEATDYAESAAFASPESIVDHVYEA